MSHDEYERQLQLFVDTELTAQERRSFQEHLSSCPECRQKLSSLASTMSLLGRMKEYRVPHSLNCRVLRALGFAVVPRWSKLASAAAAVLAGTWIGFLSGSISLPGLGSVSALLKTVLSFPDRLAVVGKLLEPILVLLRAGALVLSSLGGVYLLTVLSMALMTLALIWWLLSQRLRPAKALALM